MLTSQAIDSARRHEQLQRDGFVRVEGLLTTAEVEILTREAAALLQRPAQVWARYQRFADDGRWESLLLAEPGRTTNFFDFLGESPAMDVVLDGLLSRSVVRDLLNRVLGDRYRLWYCQIRRAETNSRPLRMHQDQPGELGMSILLSDVRSQRGTTVFLRGSHRWPRIINSLPIVSPRRIPFWTRGVQGSPGDLHFFYNDTWHGATPARGTPATAIILTFLPAGRDHHARHAPESLRDRVGPSLRAVLAGTAMHCETVPDSEKGPDEVIGGRLPPRRLFSPWRIPMIGAAIAERVLKLYRDVRKRRRQRAAARPQPATDASSEMSSLTPGGYDPRSSTRRSERAR